MTRMGQSIDGKWDSAIHPACGAWGAARCLWLFGFKRVAMKWTKRREDNLHVSDSDVQV